MVAEHVPSGPFAHTTIPRWRPVATDSAAASVESRIADVSEAPANAAADERISSSARARRRASRSSRKPVATRHSRTTPARPERAITTGGPSSATASSVPEAAVGRRSGTASDRAAVSGSSRAHAPRIATPSSHTNRIETAHEPGRCSPCACTINAPMVASRVNCAPAAGIHTRAGDGERSRCLARVARCISLQTATKTSRSTNRNAASIDVQVTTSPESCASISTSRVQLSDVNEFSSTRKSTSPSHVVRRTRPATMSTAATPLVR